MTTVHSLSESLRVAGEQREADREAELPALVALAFKLGVDYTAPVYTAGQFAAVLTAINSHNRYDHEKAIAGFGPLVAQMMNVDIEQFTGGPALYFTVPFFPSQRLAARHGWTGTGEKYTSAERIELAATVIDVAKALHADEIDTVQFPYDGKPARNGATGPSPYRIRVWWD